MNIHISKNTPLQSWKKNTVFHEYPLHIRPGKFTVTLLFQDLESMKRLAECVFEMINEVESCPWPLEVVKDKLS